MNVKEEELNSIIMELRKNIEALQEKFAKEEAAKLVGFAGQWSLSFYISYFIDLIFSNCEFVRQEAVDAYNREKHARDTAEKLQVSLSEELKRAQQDTASANQKVRKNLRHIGLASLQFWIHW